MVNELLKLIQHFPDEPWDWGELSKNSNITMKDVDAHPDKPWEQLLI